MDPYSYFIGNLDGNEEMLLEECEVYENCSAVFVTEEMYKENMTNEFSKYLYKTIPVKYGNFRCIDVPLKKNIYESDKINCVYVGSLLNESIRSPKYLYNIINRVNDDFCFHIICNHFTEENKKLKDKELIATEKVKWYYNLPLNECMAIISHADILINLGNRSINQTPSKIFDYIATGNPIINFYSLRDDTSMYYLEKYENKLNLYENYDEIDANAKKFVEFSNRNKGKKIDKDTLLKNYSIYLSEKVSSEIAYQISNIVDNE